ncbi:MAG: TonB family protein, partial [Bacteroides sp.]|nr:TonB family protein [Bacteroides sp.]
KPIPKAKPKPVKKAVIKRPSPVVKPKQTPRLVSAPPSINKVVKTKDVAPVTDEALQRDRYLAIILAHIDKHKYYPRTARRRGSEGVIHISFELLHSGEIRSLQVSGENRNLCKAAEATMREALPLPLPPEGITFPMSVQFGMKYQLN